MIAVVFGTVLAFAFLILIYLLFRIVWQMAVRRDQPPWLWFVVSLILTPLGAMIGLWLIYPKVLNT